MTDTFPRQYARTRRFTLGAPRSFEISPDGNRVVFLRSKGGSDPVTCLWLLDVSTGQEHLIADPAGLAGLSADGSDLEPGEKARRERSREQAAGIVAFSCDDDFRLAVFGLSGRVYAADLGVPAAGDTASGAVREIPVRVPAADPRPDPAGQFVAYACAGALRVISLNSGEDRVIAAPDTGGARGAAEAGGAGGAGQAEDAGEAGGAGGAGGAGQAGGGGDGRDGAGSVSFGLAEFIAAEEMRRMRGFWWAPDSSALLVARVDESPVQRWHIADPSDPARPAAEVRYPAAGTPNAVVSLLLAGLNGQHTPVSWDSDTFPYLVTACWAGSGLAADLPLIVVQSRDQREMRLLTVDRRTGGTTVLRADSDPHWLDIIPGVPARTAADRIVWTADAGGAHRLVVAAGRDLAAGLAAPVTPDGLQVREVLSVDGDTVLFAASDEEPTEIGLWTYGPDGLARLAVGDGGPGTLTGRRAGGTTVAVRRSMDQYGGTAHVLREIQARPEPPGPDNVRVQRDIQVARIASVAETPLLPAPAPRVFPAGEHGIRTALLLPSWHQPGTGRLPVLMNPYGGPHGQEVQACRDAFLTSQWLAEQGFAVIVADGRGTPGRGPDWEKTVAGDLAGPPLADQVEALHAAAARFADLDLGRVAMRGWSFGGYLSALAVLRRPDVFHAAVAGAPVTDWRLYDTHYTERYLGLPDDNPAVYEQNSLLADAHKLTRPLLIIHGLADDNVVVAHSLRLSSALLAAGRPHSVLPLSGVTHMTTQEEVAENLLLLQVDFLRKALGVAIVTPG